MKKTNDCIGAEVEAAVKDMKNGEVRRRWRVAAAAGCMHRAGCRCCRLGYACRSRRLHARPLAGWLLTWHTSPWPRHPATPSHPPQLLLLENVRFYKEEEKNEPEFAKKLAAHADL